MKSFAELNATNHSLSALLEQADADHMQVRLLLSKLPDYAPPNIGCPDYGEDRTNPTRSYWTCHGLCRLVAPTLSLPWQVVDGYWGARGNNHCWLMLHNKHMRLLLDVYPIGSIGIQPLLLHAEGSVLQTYQSPGYSPEELHRFETEAATAANILNPQKAAH